MGMNTTRCPELWPWKRWGDTWGRVQSVLVNKMNEDSEKWGERDRDPETGERLSLFPVAAVINYHKFCGLNQHKWILLYFWTSEVQNGSHWAKIRVSSRAVFLLEALREEFVSLLFSASGSHPRLSSWPCITLTICGHISFYHPLASLLCRSSRLHWAHLESPGSSPHRKSLNLITSRVPFTAKEHMFTHSGDWDRHFWETIILSTTERVFKKWRVY